MYSWLSAQARKPDVTFVYANCQYDMGWIGREGVDPINPPIDVQGMAALLDEHKMSCPLDALGQGYFGRGKSGDAFKEACAAGGLTDPMAHMDLVPAWLAEPYGIDDAEGYARPVPPSAAPAGGREPYCRACAGARMLSCRLRHEEAGCQGQRGEGRALHARIRKEA